MPVFFYNRSARFDGKIEGVRGFNVNVGLDAPLFSEEQIRKYAAFR